MNKSKIQNLENATRFHCYNNGTDLLVSDDAVYIIKMFRKSQLPRDIKNQLEYIETGEIRESVCPLCRTRLSRYPPIYYLKCNVCNAEKLRGGNIKANWVCEWMRLKFGVKVNGIVKCFTPYGSVILCNKEMSKPIYFCLDHISGVEFYVQTVNNIFVQIEFIWRKLKNTLLFIQEICGSHIGNYDVFLHFLKVMYIPKFCSCYDY